MLALAVAAVALAALTWRFVEAPAAALFRRRPYALALGLVALLAATGIVGRVTYDSKGFPGRFPPLVTQRLRLQRQRRRGRAPDARASISATTAPIRSTRSAGARRGFFDDHRCGVAADPAKPTILVVGDSHAAHLFAGLNRAYGDRANVMALAAVFCVPLVETVADGRRASRERRAAGRSTTTCSSGSARSSRTCWSSAATSPSTTTRRTGAIPASSTRWSPAREDCTTTGVASIVIAGEVPTWAPVLPILVGRDLLETGAAAEFSRVGVRPDSLETDRALAAKDWGPGVVYVSQADKLCGAHGCRRLVGANLPDDLLAVDYGHYSLEGLDLRGQRPSSRRRSTPRSKGRDVAIAIERG